MPQAKNKDPQVSTASGSRSEGATLPSARVSPTGDVSVGRTDDDAITNRFADVVSGEHQGRRVIVGSATELGDDGYPTKVIVRTRDDRDEMLVLDYADLRPAPAGGR